MSTVDSLTVCPECDSMKAELHYNCRTDENSIWRPRCGWYYECRIVNGEEVEAYHRGEPAAAALWAGVTGGSDGQEPTWKYEESVHRGLCAAWLRRRGALGYSQCGIPDKDALRRFIDHVEQDRGGLAVAGHTLQEDGVWFECDLLTGTRCPYTSWHAIMERDAPPPPEAPPSSERPTHLDGASLFGL